MAVSFTPTTVSNPVGVQGSYPQKTPIGHEGMIADLQAYVSRSYRNQSGAVIPFGALVMSDTSPGSNDPLAVELATAATGIVGLALDSLTFEGAVGPTAYVGAAGQYPGSAIDADGRMGYPDKQTVNVMSKGVALVYTTEAVTLGDAVRFFIVSHTGTLAGSHVGRFGKSAVANKTVAITAGARWLSKASAGGLALLELDIPGATFAADV